MVGIRSAKSCQTDFQNSRAITVRATPDRRGPAGGATCSDPTRGLYGGHVPRRESPAMYRVRPYRPFALALLVGALACTIRVIQPAPAATPGGGGGGPKPDSAKKDLPWKPFAEVTKDARVQTGLFTVYLKRESAYLALKPEQLDHNYLMVTELSQGIGELGIDGGSDVRSDLIRFHRAGDHVELWVVNPYATATPNTPMARTVAYSFGQSVAQSFPIASIRDTTNEVLVDLAPFFVSDWADLGAFFQFLSQQTPMQGPGPMFDKERSSFTSLHMFPTNAEAESRLTFRTARSFGLDMVPDYRWIPVGVHYSIVELRATPMRPRYADDRVGYFVSAMKNFSRDTAESFFVRYVNRWRLEKKDPSAAVSDPVKPITYYLDRTIPFEWRPYVRDGILEWNRAFEEAGIRNAIQVLDAPDDSLWSAEDARYSTVRWMANNAFTYAIGPSDVDPRTGEILNADILIAASWIQAWQGEYRDYAGPQAMIREVFLEDSLLRADPGGRRLQRLGSYGGSMAHEGTLLGETPDAERPGLKAIAAQASDPEHVYATDEDAGFAAYGLDPTVTRWDQTSDPLAWAKDRVTLVNRLFDSLETRLVAAGDGYPKLRRGFRDLLFERWYATLVTTKYLAGAFTSRDHRGDPNGRPPFSAVSAARQREALAFIADAGLGENLYRFRPELLNKLAPERWWHWGVNPFREGRIDFPLHDWALAFQGTLVQLLMDPQVLSRVRDAELRAESRNQTVTIPDILTTLTASVWAEAGVQGSQRARNTTSIRRDLQRLYLARLLRMVVTPDPGTPEDARTVARATLASLSGALGRALVPANELDGYTQAHYADSRQRIEQALNAQVVQPLGPTPAPR